MIFCGGILAAVFYRIAAALDEILAVCLHCAAAVRFYCTAARCIDAARGGAFFVAFLAARGKILSDHPIAAACLISLYRLTDLLRGDFRIDQRALRIAIKKI